MGRTTGGAEATENLTRLMTPKGSADLQESGGCLGRILEIVGRLRISWGIWMDLGDIWDILGARNSRNLGRRG